MRITRIGQTSFAVRPWRRLVVGLVMFASLATVPASEAWASVGDLLVSPVRVVLEGRQRSAQVTLVNKGTETGVYRVSIVNRRMLQNGAFEVIEEPGPDEKFAGELVRYAPRRITLEPDAPQTIRILLRKPSDLPAGVQRKLIDSIQTANERHLRSHAGNDDLASRIVSRIHDPAAAELE